MIIYIYGTALQHNVTRQVPQGYIIIIITQAQQQSDKSRKLAHCTY